MDRITTKHLNSKLRILNERTVGNPEPPYSTPRAFTIDSAYGGYRLERYINNSGGVTDISPRGTKREINNFLYALLIGMNIANEQKQDSK